MALVFQYCRFHCFLFHTCPDIVNDSLSRGVSKSVITVRCETGSFTNLFLIILTSGAFVEPQLSLLLLLVFFNDAFFLNLIIFTANGYIPGNSVVRIFQT